MKPVGNAHEPARTFSQEQTDALLRFRLPAQPFPADCAGGSACRTELHRALSAMLRAAGSARRTDSSLSAMRAWRTTTCGTWVATAPPMSYLSNRRANRRAGGRRRPVQLVAPRLSVDTLHRETLLYGQDRGHQASLPTGASGIWPATTTALKWMNCVPKCCLRQRLG